MSAAWSTWDGSQWLGTANTRESAIEFGISYGPSGFQDFEWYLDRHVPIVSVADVLRQTVAGNRYTPFFSDDIIDRMVFDPAMVNGVTGPDMSTSMILGAMPMITNHAFSVGLDSTTGRIADTAVFDDVPNYKSALEADPIPSKPPEPAMNEILQALEAMIRRIVAEEVAKAEPKNEDTTNFNLRVKNACLDQVWFDNAIASELVDAVDKLGPTNDMNEMAEKLFENEDFREKFDSRATYVMEQETSRDVEDAPDLTRRLFDSNRFVERLDEHIQSEVRGMDFTITVDR